MAEEKKELTGGGCAVLVFSFIASMVIGFILNGVAVSFLWEWFVKPIFPGTLSLSFLSAVGLSLVVSYLAYRSMPSSKDDGADDPFKLCAKMIAEAVGRPAIGLLFGWVIHLCM